MRKIILSFLIPFFVDREPTIDFVDDRIERHTMRIICGKAPLPCKKATVRKSIPVPTATSNRRNIDVNCYYSQPI